MGAGQLIPLEGAERELKISLSQPQNYIYFQNHFDSHYCDRVLPLTGLTTSVIFAIIEKCF